MLLNTLELYSIKQFCTKFIAFHRPLYLQGVCGGNLLIVLA